MNKKVKIPTNAELYKKRFLYHEKKDPIWVTLEKEMQDKAARGIKPYNTKVGNWLKFMKQLHYHYYMTGKRNYSKMCNTLGPPWYIEFSIPQRGVLRKLPFAMHADLFENRPTRTTKALAELGFTITFPKEMLMTAMELSIEDPGTFFWELYKLLYKMSPSEPRSHYDANAQLMMSALLFSDIEECRKELHRITTKKPAPPKKTQKQPIPFFQPHVKFGEYLQKMYVPCYSNHPAKIPKKKKALPIEKKVKLRNAKLEERKERNRQSKPKERICNYKFWQAPSSLRNTDPTKVAYILKMTMFKKRPKPGYLKYKPPLDNLQVNVKGVSYSFGEPIYHLDGINTLKTDFITINGGYVIFNGGGIVNILGNFRYPPKEERTCIEDCNCEPKWMRQVKEHLEATRCYCDHYYDRYTTKKHESKPKTKYFHPPKKFTPLYVDTAKVYQWDEWEEFIKDGVEEALASRISTPTVSNQTVLATQLKSKELLEAFLADLSHTPLITPHLPDANLIKELQELVRQRVKGDLTKKTQDKLMLRTKRNWLKLDHLDFHSRAYMIPFTEKQIDNLNFSHRHRLQKLCNKMLSNFSSRTRKLWLEHTRLFWNTMKFEKFPNKRFLDIFFTYMPVREMDLFVYNPYSPDTTPKYGAKTCPLRR